MRCDEILSQLTPPSSADTNIYAFSSVSVFKAVIIILNAVTRPAFSKLAAFMSHELFQMNSLTLQVRTDTH